MLDGLMLHDAHHKVCAIEKVIRYEVLGEQ